VGNTTRVFLIVWIYAMVGGTLELDLSVSSYAKESVEASTVKQVPPLGASPSGAEIDQVQLTCRIDGRQLAVTMDFEARTRQASCRMALVQGDVVLEKLDPALVGGRLDYDPNDKVYYVVWPGPGRHRVTAAFLARSWTEAGDPWRQAHLQVPGGRVRQIRLTSSQPDLEVQLPGALRVQRRVDQGRLVVEALLGPRAPLEIRWKPQMQLADAKLVLSSQANTVVDVRAGLMQVDAQFDFQIAQGKLEVLTFNVPAGLSITALQGLSIRTWTLGDKEGDGVRPLRVELSRAQDKDYHLHIHAETAIDALPSTVEIPALEPTGDLRATGYLAVGTNSALQLVVQESSGLTQIDAAGFPRVQAPDGQVMPIPHGKAFFYTHAGSRYRLRLAVDDMAPTYEVAGRLIAKVKEDDLVVDAELELDVRDAHLRQLEITAPAGLVVAAVDGNQVGDYHLPDAPAAGQPAVVRVLFKKPVIGRTLLHLRLELGRGPLGELRSIPALPVAGAKTQRGYVVIAADPGIEIDPPQVGNLREVHTASVPLRVAQAQYAYRFRDADWTLSLMARRRPAQIRTEVFQLQSIGEAIAYGSAVINYFITGAPLDELRFRLPQDLENVEFVGRDVRRWVRQDDVWVVKLNRKVLGDYSLAATYTQRYGPDRPIQLGALHCQDVQTQTGYVAVTSHLDLRLQLVPGQAADQSGLLPIALDEVPADYRLLTNSPMLAAYKYVTESHVALLAAEPYQRSGLLPVVVDIADLQTELAVRPDKRIESMTTIRYKIKNTTGQFLSLTMPAEARVWAVAQIEPKSGGGEQLVRLAASHEQDSGRLLIPLRRQANPNDPTTIELKYGQVHQSRAWWRRTVDLSAPCCTVPVTYANWKVTVPQRWAIQAVGGSMQPQPQPQPQARAGLAGFVNGVVVLWQEALERTLGNQAFWAFVGLTIVLVVVYAFLRRQHTPDVILFVVLVLAIWLGISAAVGQLDRPQPLTALSCAQAVSADSNQALHINASLIPAWRQAVNVWDAVGVAIILAALVLTLGWRRLRKVALAAAVAAVIYLSAKLPITWPVLKALMTWLAPAAAMLWFIHELRRRRRLPAQAAAALILAIAWTGGGCASLHHGPQPVGRHAAVERVECALTAGPDSMEMKYNLRISADRPLSLPLLDESAVLVSPAQPEAGVTIQLQGGRHVVRVDKPGVYNVEAVFLTALPRAGGEDQQRRFELALPPALANRVSLAIPDANVSIEAPGAVFLTSDPQKEQMRVEAMFTPGGPAVFVWRPLERQAAREAVRFYAQDVALANVTPGLLQVFHEVRLQIAQGQVDKLTLDVAPDQTVTSVNGPQVGAWRFDPVGHHVEVRLSQPAAGSYALVLITQKAGTGMPYDVRLEPLVVQGALDQHSILGLAADPSVYVQLEQHPAAMNVQDYAREAPELIKAVPGLAIAQIGHAFRFESKGNAVTGRVQAVQSEVRSRETARFNVEDDRLVYNSQWEIEIAKAGRFDLDLLIPEGFDIDALEAEEISHWDDSPAGSASAAPARPDAASGKADQRLVRVHFKNRLTGLVRLKLALSRAVAEIPDQLAAPRVTAVGGLKHAGYLIVGSVQGVRVSVASRQGVSEVNPIELGQTGQGLLAFQFLRPDWQLQLQTELIQARVTVQSLHVAKVTDGLVRHQHALRYRLYHAGTKAFALTLPPEAVGVTITGPGIARREQSGPGQWRVELADKVYDQPYLMSVAYETRYDPADGNVPLAPVRCQDADLQQGYTAVFATDRMEVAAGSTDAILRPADARSIPDYFGAGDLSGAAMCYRSVSAQYSLAVRAKRHAAADQIGAEVLKTDLVTVVTAAGQTINRVVLLLRVGSQRHLQTILPEGAAIWSLAVDGQAVQPSLRTTAEGRRTLLVPLPQQASDDVLLEMIYIAALPSPARGPRTPDWSGRHTLAGPRFDLPLKNITWQVHVPDDFTYGDFGGTLTAGARIADVGGIARYDLQTYQQQIVAVNQRNEQVAQRQQTRARELAQQGDQTAARQALTKGYNFSMGNVALNEDIRVDLDNLVRQQAKVGLANAIGRLRQQSGEAADSQVRGGIPVGGQGLNQQQVQRIESSLGQADSENLELITRRIIQTQAAAETSVSQIQVTMPICGQILRFDSPVQVEPASEMAVVFTARPQHLAKVDPSLGYGFGLFAFLLAGGAAVGGMRRRWAALGASLCRMPRNAAGSGQPPRSAQSSESSPLDDRDDPPNQVSAEELL